RTGWRANATGIQVYIGPLNPGYGYLCPVAADGVGAFSQSCPVNQALAQGTYLATATNFSITVTGNAVTVNPALTYVNPTYANPTNSVTINGSGFAADSVITVKLGSVTGASYTTNSLGGLSYVSFTVPNGTAAGPTTITVTDSASPPNSASIAFTVYNATIAISPSPQRRPPRAVRSPSPAAVGPRIEPASRSTSAHSVPAMASSAMRAPMGLAPSPRAAR